LQNRIQEVTPIPGSVAVLVFPRDLEAGNRICEALEDGYRPSLVIYDSNCLGDILKSFDLVVAVMAVGIVVRSLCGHLEDKWKDTPVVAVDSALHCAVPVVGGHHGANDLAQFLRAKLGLYPAITTATDAFGRPSLERTARALNAEIMNPESSKELNLAFLKEDVPVLRLKGPKIVIVDSKVAVLKGNGIVVGLGSRKGVSAKEVLEALDSALNSVGRKREEIRVLATAWLKRDEAGIKEAAKSLGKEVIYLSAEVLNSQTSTTPSRASDLGLLGVAEPAALALSDGLLMAKRAYGRVTVALGE
jgi:cobalt-precorrin 5A hydrolase